MKIKSIEKIIDLKDLFEILKEVVQPRFEVDDHSRVTESNLLFIALGKKTTMVQILAFNDLEFDRTIISILVLKKNQKFTNLQIDLDEKESFYRLINPKDFKSYSKRMKIEYNELEGKLYKKILLKIKNKYDYRDRLLNFPFSLTSNFESNGDYFAQYSKFLDVIERKINSYGNNHSQILRYYDFAKSTEIYQRIIDMIVISNKLVEEKQNNTYWMLFIYSNKSPDEFGLLELVKLFGEIREYSKVIQKRLKTKNQIIKTALVILSINGFEESLPKYLRTHLYGDFEHIIPIFIIPPYNDEIWHNLNKDRSLTADIAHKKKEVKMKIKRLRIISNPTSYRKDQIDMETKNLSDLNDKMCEIEKNYELVDIFSKILSIEEFKRKFSISGKKSNIKEDKLIKNNEKLYI